MPIQAIAAEGGAFDNVACQFDPIANCCIPIISMMCKNCGNMLQFNALLMGIFSKEGYAKWKDTVLKILKREKGK